MKPIVTICGFSDGYAELAAVSLTSLVYNTQRDCNMHILENSLSEEIKGKILKIEEMYSNAKITFHHISDEVFEDVVDNKRWVKETWYPLLAPEILRDYDRVLVLEPDTLVCSDVSELFDMDMGDCYAAVSPRGPMIAQYDTHVRTFSKFNAGVILYNLTTLREDDVFNMHNLVRTSKMGRSVLHDGFYGNETFQSWVFDDDRLAFFDRKYNSMCRTYLTYWFYTPVYNIAETSNFDETLEAFNNPAIIHFAGFKPNKTSDTTFYGDFRYLKWWEYLARSPFAEPEKDKERLADVIRYRKRFKGKVLSIEDYHKNCAFCDFMEAFEKLKELSKSGMKIAFYGAGNLGGRIFRLARLMGVVVDKICDQTKFGRFIDAIKIESPEALLNLRSNCIVVIAIEQPSAWVEISEILKGMGYPEKHIFPIFEHLAVGGREWDELLQSIEL